MLIQNKSNELQRTSVKWVKTDIKPWEIVECEEREALTVCRNYWNLFQIVKKKAKE